MILGCWEVDQRQIMKRKIGMIIIMVILRRRGVMIMRDTVTEIDNRSVIIRKGIEGMIISLVSVIDNNKGTDTIDNSHYINIIDLMMESPAINMAIQTLTTNYNTRKIMGTPIKI